jgi:CSLREA domain-containing protein
VLAIAAILSLATGAATAMPAAQAGVTYVVNTTADSDDFNIGDGICDGNSAEPGEQCSLRAAIREVNAGVGPGPDRIHFSIGAGPQTITPSFPVGGILRPVIVDGTTQPGFTGTPLIELNGTQSAIFLPGGDGMRLLGGNSTIRGLVINRFGNNAISLIGTAGGNVVAGNYIGTDLSGTTALGNGGNGVYIESSANRVGGIVPADRNVISGNREPGVGITGNVSNGGSVNVVQGNYIGTNAAGTAAITIPPGGAGQSNGIIITLGARDNVVGGPLSGTGVCDGPCNLLSGAVGFSGLTVLDGAHHNNVRGNFVGTDRTGNTPIPSQGGIQIIRAHLNTVGGSETDRNVISGNIEHGILINEAAATENQVTHNHIGLTDGRPTRRQRRRWRPDP